MQKQRKESSSLVAILQTAGFLAVIIGIVGLVIYFSGIGHQPPEKRTDGYQYLSISDLADFYYETPTSDLIADSTIERNIQIPEKIRQLDGKKVSITGFMMPVRVDNDGNVDEFAINGNYDMCFYGAPSSLNQWVHVKMQNGIKARFSHNPTTVSGVLEVGELIENGEVISLYRLNGHNASSQSRNRF